MPAVPVVMAVSGASAAIGAGVATAIGLGTVSTVAATAIGTGLVAGAMTAAEGGDAGDVLKSAVVGGATTYLGGTIAGNVGPAVAEATGSEVAGRVAGSVAAAGVTSGGDPEAMLRAGLTSGASAGLSAAREAAVDEYLRSIEPGGYDDSNIDVAASMGLPGDQSLYPPQDFGVPVSMDTQFYAAAPDDFMYDIGMPSNIGFANQALQSGMSAYTQNADGSRTYRYDDGSSVTVDQSANVVDYVPSSDILLASPEQRNTQAEEDLNRKLSALNVAQRVAPTAVNAFLNRNANQMGQFGTLGSLNYQQGSQEPLLDSELTPDLRHQVARIGAPKDQGEFESFLSPFFAKVEGKEDLPDNQNKTETAFMQQPYFNYGTESPIDQILNLGGDQKVNPFDAVFAAAGGAISPLMGAGTRHGKYAVGGMTTPLMAAGGKTRVDFRQGDAVTGPGDGQSDDIPAMLADGEFVFPADVVAAIGNGSTKAGSDKLYDMMHGIRKHVRSAKPKDLPPEIKSPLDFLKA